MLDLLTFLAILLAYTTACRWLSRYRGDNPILRFAEKVRRAIAYDP